MSRARLVFVAGLTACLAAAAAPTWSAWTSVTINPASALGAAADWQAPRVTAAVVDKSGGGSTGFIRAGTGYYVYAGVVDGGNPASGTTAVSAGVGAITTGLTAAPLVAGSYTAQGVAYNRRSALLTSDSALAAGSYATTIATTDAAANSAVVAGPSVTADMTAPTGTSVQTHNGGLIAGRPDAGDTVTLGWSETLDPTSLLAGWDGSATAIQVVIADGGPNNDVLTISSPGGVTLPVGSFALGNNFVTASTTFNATMTQSGAGIVVTVGALVSGAPHTDTHTSALVWLPAATAGATDRAGNALAGSMISGSGTAGYDF